MHGMPTPDERRRARDRLALRAERAMGLNTVRPRRSTLSAVATERAIDEVAPVENRRCTADTPPPAVTAQPAQDAQASRPAAATPAIGLFGSISQAPKIDDSPLVGDPLPPAERAIALQQLDAGQVKGCTKCRLSETRTHTVFGEGAADARLMFIGEGPGENEDLSGRPFVGKAGQLLDKMIGAMGLSREQVYICNIVKCRPPNNRQPAADETAACTPYLLEQVSVIRPEVIVTLGLPSTQYVLSTKNSMSKMRGKWHSWRGIKVMPTYHPAYVLRQYTPQTREAVWGDLKLVLAELKLTLPTRPG